MKKYLLVLLSIVVCSPVFAQVKTDRKIAVAVMDLRGSGISETDAKFLTERLMIELQRTDVFDVLERDKMGEILKEQGFQQTGACDNTACLVEIGRLLPVEKMIGGSVGKLGETYSVQIRLIDLRTAKVEKTATKDFEEKIDYLLTKGIALVANEIICAKDKSVNFKNNKTTGNIIDSSFARVIKVLVFDNKSLWSQAGGNRERYEWLRGKNKDRVIINKGKNDQVKTGDIYKLLRFKEKNIITDPITKEVLKKEINTIDIANIRVIKVEPNISECLILNSYKEIIIGDKVYEITMDSK